MKRAKGIYLQNYVEKVLTEMGYCVHNQKPVSFQLPSGVWVSKRNDIFSAFDLIASNKDEIRFIQVTADTNFKRKLEKLHLVKLPAFCKQEIWFYKGRGRFLILTYDGKELHRSAELVKRQIRPL